MHHCLPLLRTVWPLFVCVRQAIKKYRSDFDKMASSEAFRANLHFKQFDDCCLSFSSHTIIHECIQHIMCVHIYIYIYVHV